MNTLAERLVWARQQKEMTQHELAKATGIAQSTIGGLETGARMTARKIATIAATLEVDSLWLSDGTGVTTPVTKPEMNWHTRLTQARKNKHLGKSELSRLLGVSPSSITMWENGQISMIEGEKLMRVCEALSITPEWLLNDEPYQVQAVTLPPSPSPRSQWLFDDEANLLSLYRAMDEANRGILMHIALALPKIDAPSL